MFYFKDNRQVEVDNDEDPSFSEWDDADANFEHLGNISPWNLRLFEERVGNSIDWKMDVSSVSKHISRLQDLCLGLESNDGAAVGPTPEAWPFESSPCHMFGGKNTKANSAYAADTNMKLFDANFNTKHSIIAKFDEITEHLCDEKSKAAPGKSRRRTIPGSSKRRPLDAGSSFSEKRTDRRCSTGRNVLHDSMQRGTVMNYDSSKAVGVNGDDKKEEIAICTRQRNRDRAMSTKNVKPPEDHMPSRAVSIGNTNVDGEQKRRGRRITAVNAIASRPLSCSRREAERLNEESLLLCGDRNSSANDSCSSDDDSCVDGALNTFGRCRRRTSLNRGNFHKPQETCGQSFTGGVHDDSDKDCAEPVRRELRELLRDNLSVSREDLECEENRRLLHFLIYEHTMGVCVEKLKATIAKERSEHPEEVMCRPLLPLYVKPA
jgi:hypothetical protein